MNPQRFFIGFGIGCFVTIFVVGHFFGINIFTDTLSSIGFKNAILLLWLSLCGGVAVGFIASNLGSIAKNPTDQYYDIGLLRATEGKFEEAEHAFRQAINFDPDFHPAKSCLAVLEEFKAKRISKEAVLHEFRGVAFTEKCIAVFYDGKLLPDIPFNNAIQEFKDAIAYAPNWARPYMDLGVIQAQAGMLNKAIENLRRACDLDQKLAQAQYNLARAYSDTKQYKLAIEYYDRAIKLGWKVDYGFQNRLEAQAPVRSSRLTLSTIKNIHGWSAERVQQLQQQTAQVLGLPVEFRDDLRSGGQGPVMVVIPGGCFLMGSPADEPGRGSNERQHKVEVAAFAIGKYTVTFEEYDRFAEATNRDKPADGGWGRGQRPVINLSWHDAIAYAEWLSTQTGQTYRLPTEAEWEYACRAGTTNAYHFGASINTNLVNYCGGGFFKSLMTPFGGNRTVEVGQYPANAWGLYDMHGNIWEWTCSVYGQNYDGSEQRCAESGTRRFLVLRGGSWANEPKKLRGAARYWEFPHYRNLDGGFRLTRTFH